MFKLFVSVAISLVFTLASAQGLSKCGPQNGTAEINDQSCGRSGQFAGIDQSLFSASTPPAGWSKVVVSDTGTLTYYANTATARRVGNHVKMWDLLDSQDVVSIGNQRYLSMHVQREYDCGEGQVRILFVSAHSGNMGMGELVAIEDNVRPWRPNSMRSVGRGLWEVACGNS